MPWVPLDTHYLDDPKIQAAGEMTPFALSVFPALLTAAKLRANGGKCEVTYRDLSHRLFMDPEEAAKALRALAAAQVVEFVEESGMSAVVRFPPATWKRWNDNWRKQKAREDKADE